MAKKSDIPIADAMIVWSPAGEIFPEGCAATIRHPDRIRDFFQQNFRYSDGACVTFWRDQSTEEQKRMLLVIAWQMVVRDGVKPQDVHTALSVIPEYRDMLAEDMPKPD